jgi:hypothetical protein
MFARRPLALVWPCIVLLAFGGIVWLVVQQKINRPAAIEAARPAPGSEHPDTVTIKAKLASNLIADGKQAKTEAEYRAIIAHNERVLGPEHPDTLWSRNNLANALFSQGKHAAAEKEHRAVLAIRERVLGPEHPDTLMSRSNFAGTLDLQGKHAAAENECRAVLAIRERVLGPRSIPTR